MSSPLALLILSLAAAPEPGGVRALLEKADGYRLAPGAMQVDVEVKTYEDGRLDKERRYRVYARPNRQSLVVSRSTVEKGQKILMLGDDFWIVLPASRRPIRITPAQKLLGDASTGDVATMTWAEDYDATLAGESVVNGVPCQRLDLRARRRGVTYARIELSLARADGRPVQADLYVLSEKLAKRATFELGQVGERTQVVRMTLTDQIDRGRKTEIRYVSRVQRAVPDKYYNPMFLAAGHAPD